MADEYGTFGVGAAVYPLATGTGRSALDDIDAPVSGLLAFFAAMLTRYMGDRWAEAAADAGLSAEQAASPVLSTLCYDPAEYLTQDQVRLPALAVYRVKSTEADKTAGWTISTSDLVVTWVMPPLGPGQMEQLWPFTRAVRDILTHIVSNGFDPSYEGGADVWTLANLGIAEGGHDRAPENARWEALRLCACTGAAA